MTDFACGLPTSTGEALAVLQNVKTIAIVGLSPKPERPSHRIAKYLLKAGYVIYPIRPGVSEILGQPAYHSLTELGRAADLVDIFRRSEAVPEIVEEAIRLGCKAIWMQEGISHATAADQARAAGLQVVENLCIYKVLRARVISA